MTNEIAMANIKAENELMLFDLTNGTTMVPSDLHGFNAECYEAHKVAIDALKMRTANPPIKCEGVDLGAARCPSCASYAPTHWIVGGISYCEYCGQAINWDC